MKLGKLGYLASSAIFGVMSAMTLLGGKTGSKAVVDATKKVTTASSKDDLIIGLTFAALALLFSVLFNVKWNEEARESLVKSSEFSKSFVKTVPMSAIGNLYFLWVILLIVPVLNPIIGKFLPLPGFAMPILSGVAMLFFILSTFATLANGKYGKVAIGSLVFALLQLASSFVNFLGTRTMPVESMVNFLVFWTLFNLFSVYSKSSAPIEKEKAPKATKVKSKKPTKKAKLDEESEKIEEKNATRVDAYIAKQKTVEASKVVAEETKIVSEEATEETTEKE